MPRVRVVHAPRAPAPPLVSHHRPHARPLRPPTALSLSHSSPAVSPGSTPTQQKRSIHQQQTPSQCWATLSDESEQRAAIARELELESPLNIPTGSRFSFAPVMAAVSAATATTFDSVSQHGHPLSLEDVFTPSTQASQTVPVMQNPTVSEATATAHDSSVQASSEGTPALPASLVVDVHAVASPPAVVPAAEPAAQVAPAPVPAEFLCPPPAAPSARVPLRQPSLASASVRRSSFAFAAGMPATRSAATQSAVLTVRSRRTRRSETVAPAPTTAATAADAPTAASATADAPLDEPAAESPAPVAVVPAPLPAVVVPAPPRISSPVMIRTMTSVQAPAPPLRSPLQQQPLLASPDQRLRAPARARTPRATPLEPQRPDQSPRRSPAVVAALAVTGPPASPSSRLVSPPHAHAHAHAHSLRRSPRFSSPSLASAGLAPAPQASPQRQQQQRQQPQQLELELAVPAASSRNGFSSSSNSNRNSGGGGGSIAGLAMSLGGGQHQLSLGDLQALASAAAVTNTAALARKHAAPPPPPPLPPPVHEARSDSDDGRDATSAAAAADTPLSAADSLVATAAAAASDLLVRSAAPRGPRGKKPPQPPPLQQRAAAAAIEAAAGQTEAGTRSASAAGAQTVAVPAAVTDVPLKKVLLSVPAAPALAPGAAAVTAPWPHLAPFDANADISLLPRPPLSREPPLASYLRAHRLLPALPAAAVIAAATTADDGGSATSFAHAIAAELEYTRALGLRFATTPLARARPGLPLLAAGYTPASEHGRPSLHACVLRAFAATVVRGGGPPVLACPPAPLLVPTEADGWLAAACTAAAVAPATTAPAAAEVVPTQVCAAASRAHLLLPLLSPHPPARADAVAGAAAAVGPDSLPSVKFACVETPESADVFDAAAAIALAAFEDMLSAAETDDSYDGDNDAAGGLVLPSLPVRACATAYTNERGTAIDIAGDIAVPASRSADVGSVMHWRSRSAPWLTLTLLTSAHTAASVKGALPLRPLLLPLRGQLEHRLVVPPAVTAAVVAAAAAATTCAGVNADTGADAGTGAESGRAAAALLLGRLCGRQPAVGAAAAAAAAAAAPHMAADTVPALLLPPLLPVPDLLPPFPVRPSDLGAAAAGAHPWHAVTCASVAAALCVHTASAAAAAAVAPHTVVDISVTVPARVRPPFLPPAVTAALSAPGSLYTQQSLISSSSNSRCVNGVVRLTDRSAHTETGPLRSRALALMARHAAATVTAATAARPCAVGTLALAVVEVDATSSDPSIPIIELPAADAGGADIGVDTGADTGADAGAEQCWRRLPGAPLSLLATLLHCRSDVDALRFTTCPAARADAAVAAPLLGPWRPHSAAAALAQPRSVLTARPEELVPLGTAFAAHLDAADDGDDDSVDAGANAEEIAAAETEAETAVTPTDDKPGGESSSTPAALARTALVGAMGWAPSGPRGPAPAPVSAVADPAAAARARARARAEKAAQAAERKKAAVAERRAATAAATAAARAKKAALPKKLDADAIVAARALSEALLRGVAKPAVSSAAAAAVMKGVPSAAPVTVARLYKRAPPIAVSTAVGAGDDAAEPLAATGTDAEADAARALDSAAAAGGPATPVGALLQRELLLSLFARYCPREREPVPEMLIPLPQVPEAADAVVLDCACCALPSRADVGRRAVCARVPTPALAAAHAPSCLSVLCAASLYTLVSAFAGARAARALTLPLPQELTASLTQAPEDRTATIRLSGVASHAETMRSHLGFGGNDITGVCCGPRVQLRPRRPVRVCARRSCRRCARLRAAASSAERPLELLRVRGASAGIDADDGDECEATGPELFEALAAGGRSLLALAARTTPLSAFDTAARLAGGGAAGAVGAEQADAAAVGAIPALQRMRDSHARLARQAFGADAAACDAEAAAVDLCSPPRAPTVPAWADGGAREPHADAQQAARACDPRRKRVYRDGGYWESQHEQQQYQQQIPRQPGWSTNDGAEGQAVHELGEHYHRDSDHDQDGSVVHASARANGRGLPGIFQDAADSERAWQQWEKRENWTEPLWAHQQPLQHRRPQKQHQQQYYGHQQDYFHEQPPIAPPPQPWFALFGQHMHPPSEHRTPLEQAQFEGHFAPAPASVRLPSARPVPQQQQQQPQPQPQRYAPPQQGLPAWLQPPENMHAMPSFAPTPAPFESSDALQQPHTMPQAPSLRLTPFVAPAPLSERPLAPMHAPPTPFHVPSFAAAATHSWQPARTQHAAPTPAPPLRPVGYAGMRHYLPSATPCPQHQRHHWEHGADHGQQNVRNAENSTAWRMAHGHRGAVPGTPAKGAQRAPLASWEPRMRSFKFG